MSAVIKSANYLKREAKFLSKHPNLRSTYESMVILLGNDREHRSLRLRLVPKGALKDRYAVSINQQHRITLFFIVIGDEINLLDVGDRDI